MASTNAMYGYHDNESLPRKSIDVSHEEIDLDELYERRYKKYLQLVAKEQELLRRMTGRRRRQRSSTLGNGLDIEEPSFSESDFTEDERETCFYRPFRNHSHPLFNRKSSSVKDLSRSAPIYARSPSHDQGDSLFSSRSGKRLSVKLELNEDDDGDISDNSSSSSFSSFSSSPKLSHRIPSNLQQKSVCSPRLTHAHSVDNLTMYSPPRSRRTLIKMRSCDDFLSDDSLSGHYYANLNIRRSSQTPISQRVHTNIRNPGDGHLSDDSYTSNLASFSIRRGSNKALSNANLMIMRNNMLTSSYRSLADRNVRETAVTSTLIAPKTLKTSSPYLERRLAEAKKRNTKRTEAMRSLDTDFTKAKEIMRRYKSTENLVNTKKSV